MRFLTKYMLEKELSGRIRSDSKNILVVRN